MAKSITERLTSADPVERAEAAWECAELSGPLIAALADPCWSVRAGAAAALGEILSRAWDARLALETVATPGWEEPALAASGAAIAACPEVGAILRREAEAVRETAAAALRAGFQRSA